MSREWLVNVSSFYSEDLHLLGEGLFGALFIVSFFYVFIRKDVHHLRWAVAFSGLFLVAIGGFFGEQTFRLMHMFLPFVILYGIAFFFLLLVVEYALTTLMVLAAAMPLIFTLLPPRATIPYPPYYPRFVGYVSGLMEPGEWLCTDMPWATAWYGDQESIQLPDSVDGFYEINDYAQRMSGIYFTTLSRDLPYIKTLRTGPYKTWFPVLVGRLPTDFPLTRAFYLNDLDQLFLTDFPRWQQQ
jgi:hypothetical protein